MKPLTSPSGWHGGGIERKREDGDVVGLAIRAGGLGYCGGGMMDDFAGAIKSEEFARGRVGFDHAIGKQGDFVAGPELQSGGGILNLSNKSEWKARLHRNLFAI